jgi:ribosomal protein S1
LQLLNICPSFHALDPILGERLSTQPQLTTDGMFHEMDDNEDGLFNEMDDKDQDQNKQAEEETKD